MKAALGGDIPCRHFAASNRCSPRVQKPARYTGGEWNSIVKDWDACDVRVALAYPDLYDIGMSNLGLGILYDIVNRREGMLAERVFAPWSDMEDAMRAEGVPLWSLETRHPAARVRRHRLLAELRGHLHQHPQHARPGGPARARRGAHRRAPADHLRRLRRAQPGRACRLRRRLRARRRRGDDRRHRRLRARVEAAGARHARRRCCSSWRRSGASTCRASTGPSTTPTARISRVTPTTTGCPRA